MLFNDIHQEKLLRIFHNSLAISRNKEILLFKNWSNNVTVANQHAELAIPHKVHTQCYIGLCFFQNLANALQNIWIWSN